jgi:O-antigen/teichoic acid export membrane protein
MPLWRMILTAINLVGVRFGGAAIGLVSQVLLARLLSQAEVGVIFMGMSAAAVFSQVITVGYPPLAITLLPRYYALRRESLAQAFYRAFWRDSLVVFAIVAAAALIVVYATSLDEGLRTAVFFGLLAAPGAAMNRINSAGANSLRRYTLSYVPDFLYRPGLFLAFLLIAWRLHVTLTVDRVLWAFVIFASVMALAQAWLIGRQGAIPPPFAAPGRNLAPYLRGRAASLVLVAIVSGAFADLVNMIGGVFLPSEDVALVGVAIRLAALAGFITQSTQTFILPDLAEALTRGPPESVRSLLLRINVLALAGIGLATLGAIVLGRPVLAIFGASYGDGHWPLVLFMVSQGFRAASGMNQHLLSLGGYQARTAGACLVAVVTLVVLSAALAPHLGLMGLAYAVVAADFVWAVLLAIEAQRFAGRRGDIVALLWAGR